MDAVKRLTKIKCARSKWFALPASHEAWQIRLAHYHLFRRIPIGPFRHSRNLLRASPGEAFAADADPVAQRLAVAEHEIEVSVRRIDDDRAGRFLGAIINERATELRFQFLLRAGLRSHFGWECGHIARVDALRRSGHTRIDCLTADRGGRAHRILQNRVLFSRTGWARRGGGGHAVVRARSGSRRLVALRWLYRRAPQHRRIELRPIGIGHGGKRLPRRVSLWIRILG